MTTVVDANGALLDTNVLVYAFDKKSAFHTPSRTLVLRAADGVSHECLCTTPQVFAEFFAVVTNPRRVRNARTPDEALAAVEYLAALPNLVILPVPVDVVARWVGLVRINRLAAARVFDAQLAATMLANGVRRIYTFDRAHFECFAGIEVVSRRNPITYRIAWDRLPACRRKRQAGSLSHA